jgi:hypothetical protein
MIRAGRSPTFGASLWVVSPRRVRRTAKDPWAVAEGLMMPEGESANALEEPAPRLERVGRASCGRWLPLMEHDIEAQIASEIYTVVGGPRRGRDAAVDRRELAAYA